MHESLRRWMEEKNLSPTELSDQIGVSKYLVYLVLRNERPITDGFRWKFAQVYGWTVANQVLGERDHAAA